MSYDRPVNTIFNVFTETNEFNVRSAVSRHSIQSELSRAQHRVGLSHKLIFIFLSRYMFFNNEVTTRYPRKYKIQLPGNDNNISKLS
jgi:hypothetical protein